MAQASLVAHDVEELSGRPVDIVAIRSEGDTDQTTPLADLGGQGVFVAAVSAALQAGECDLAVHSLKDLPTEPADGLIIVTPRRADARDVLCARDGLTFEVLPSGAKVGTGSPRRIAQLKALRPDLTYVGVRGNVESRLDHVVGSRADLDAVVLAHAGLDRLGRLDAVTDIFDPETLTPAPGQGALAIEAREQDARVDQIFAGTLIALDHVATRWAVAAERAVLVGLGAGCSAPVGAYAVAADTTITLRACLGSLDGGEPIVVTDTIDLPTTVRLTEEGEVFLAGIVNPMTALLDGDRLAQQLGFRVAQALGSASSTNE
jgi:hydroxymethylbilane synthase